MATTSVSDAEDWDRSCLERERAQVFLGVALILTFVPVFSIHDYVLEPDVWRFHLGLRALSVPLILGTLVAAARATTVAAVRRATDAFYLTITVLLAVMVPGDRHYWPAVLGYSCLVWGMGASFAAPLPRATALLSLPVVAFVVVSAVAPSRPVDDVLGALAYLLTASLIVTAGVAIRYRTLFEAHRAGRQLERARDELEAAKNELERRVADRTEQLTRTVTELQREMQVRIRAEEEAQLATRAKSAFLANVSHELRTPLNAIIGYGELLREELVDLGSPSLADDLSRIDQSAHHLLSTIDDVLDLTRIEGGKLEVHVAPVDPGRVLAEAMNLVAPLAAARDNVVRVELSDVGPVLADPLRMRQVLVNLLSNAAKFTHGGRIEVVGRRTPQGVELAVRDTGIGIAEHLLPTLFERFRQLDDTPTRQYGGLGLGLAISRELATAMGGRIDVESVLGVGTTFRLVLPSAA